MYMEKTLFILEDPLLPKEFLLKINQDSNAQVFSLNYNVHKVLSKKNIPHEISENLLDHDDIQLIDEKAIKLSTSWYENQELQSTLTYEKILLPSLIENEIFQYLSPILRSAVCILRIIEKEKPTKIFANTLLNNFLEQICKSKNILLQTINLENQPVLVLDKINVKFNLGSIPISFTVSRKTYLKIKKLFEKIVNSFFNFNLSLESTKKNILLLDFNPVPYEILLNNLSNLDRNIVLLNQRRPAIWNLKSLLIIKKSNCKIINLDSYHSILKSKINLDSNQFKKDLDSLFENKSIFEDLFLLEKFSLWSSIKNSFTNICYSRFSESIERIVVLKKLFKDYNFSVILEWAEAGQEEKEVLSIANEKKIPSVMLQHAIVTTTPYWIPYARFIGDFPHKLMSNKQAVWSQKTKDYAKTYGYKDENLFVSGSPRFDKFFNQKKSSSKGIILFAPVGASNVSIEYSNSSSFENFDNFVRKICEVAKTFPDKQFVIKPHPRPDFLNNMKELINEIDPNIKISYSTNLIKLISECDVLITTNNSTIALESLILGKPTISLQTEKWALDEEISKSGAIIPVSKIDEIETELTKILSDENYKHKLLEKSKKFVEENLAFRGNASKSLSNFLNSF